MTPRLLYCAAVLLPVLAFNGLLQAADAPAGVVSAIAEKIVVSPPPGSSSTLAKTPRILLVTSPKCEACGEELKKLEAPGGTFEVLKKKGWKVGPGPENHVQIIDQSGSVDPEIAAVVAELKPVKGPVVVCVEEGKIARSFQHGCTTPLDPWTFGWLMTGNDERPAEYKPEPITVATTGNYRLRGNHWSIEGNWNPTRDDVARHLRSFHSNGIQAGWKVETWSIDELKSLHDDIHEREEGFRGRYAAAAAKPTSAAGSAGKPGSFKR